MCGIFGILNENNDEYYNQFMKGKKRGPESSTYYTGDNFILGFHRLAINGFEKPESNQPIELKNCKLICNGEIYNWKKLHNELNIKTSTFSDCEIIIHMYRAHGMQYTLKKLDGVFAFILYDETSKEFFIARDQFGVRPLFHCFTEDNKSKAFSSNLDMLLPSFYKNEIFQFKPGMCLNIKKGAEKMYSFFPMSSPGFYNLKTNKIHEIIRNALYNAVKKRVENTDRKIGCLLSGGLDSSLIASIVANEIHPTKLYTFSIGMKGSPDLEFAKKAAEHIGSIHHSIELTKDDFLEAIDDVIYDIESYCTTTVRASVGNWLVAKYIKENTDIKVVFCGDGADECCGGYIYMSHAPDCQSFDKECIRLLENIHYYDVLRSDRTISSHGLEPRTPFLDRSFVSAYLNIPSHLRFSKLGEEKKLLRDAFSELNYLPDSILYRRKEAFSDGVSSQTESWHDIIKTHISENKLAENEESYYKKIFEKNFGKRFNIIPGKWMPKFIKAEDPSARTLTNIYNLV